VYWPTWNMLNVIILFLINMWFIVAYLLSV